MAKTESIKMEIIRATTETQLDNCAGLMSSCDPFVTLRFDYERCRSGMNGEYREIYLAMVDGQFAGFVVLMFVGVLRGYIQTICLEENYRGKGIGTALLNHAEERLSKEFPNVFMCVSSFNHAAQKLYYRLGYEKIGELKNHIIMGADEYILRKQTSPIMNFKPSL